MHAWAEVEHDLLYKPEKGAPSEDESAILDEINGMVLAGEIALERLQRAIERRSSKDDLPFNDQFDLARYLSQRAAKLGMSISDIGKVDGLIVVLRALHQDKPAELNRYLDQVAQEDRSLPVADVVLDKVLSSQPTGTAERLSEILSKALSRRQVGTPGETTETAFGYFLTQWISLEKAIARLTPLKNGERFSLSRAVQKLELDQSLIGQIRNLRNLRNTLVHGLERPDPVTLGNAGRLIEESILPQLKLTRKPRR